MKANHPPPPQSPATTSWRWAPGPSAERVTTSPGVGIDRWLAAVADAGRRGGGDDGAGLGFQQPFDGGPVLAFNHPCKSTMPWKNYKDEHPPQ